MNASFAAEMLRATQLLGLECFQEADRALEGAQQGATGDEERAAAFITRANLRFWHLADRTGALQVLDEASRLLTDRRCADDVAVQRAALLLFAGRTADALADVERVRTGHDASSSALVLGAAVKLLARGLHGDVRGSAAPGPTGRPPAGDDGGVLALQWGLVDLAASLARAFNGLDATSVDDPGPGTRPCESTSGVADGIRLLWAGRPRRAVAVLDRAVALLQQRDRGRLLPVALGELAYARALLGDADGATAAAHDAERARHPCSRIDELSVGRGHAWAAAARGELTAAGERAMATAEACHRLGQPVLAAQAWHDVARLGDPASAAAPLQALADGQAAGPDDDLALVPSLAAHVGALVAGDAAGVGRASVAARRRGHLLHAAEAAAQAAALRAAHRRVERDRWADTAEELAAGCEGARTPPLARVHDLDLTPREREVVGLVARGLSNREIAHRLDLSVRTVANHLQASYDKLDVHRRQDLARLHGFSPLG